MLRKYLKALIIFVFSFIYFNVFAFNIALAADSVQSNSLVKLPQAYGNFDSNNNGTDNFYTSNESLVNGVLSFQIGCTNSQNTKKYYTVIAEGYNGQNLLEVRSFDVSLGPFSGGQLSLPSQVNTINFSAGSQIDKVVILKISGIAYATQIIATGKYVDQSDNTIVTACLRDPMPLNSSTISSGLVCQTRDAANNVLDVKGSSADLHPQCSNNFQFTMTQSSNANATDFFITGNNGNDAINRYALIKTQQGYTINGNIENESINTLFQVVAYSKNKAAGVASLNVKCGQNSNYSININDASVVSPSDITVQLRKPDFNQQKVEELNKNITKTNNGYKIESILSSSLTTNNNLGIMSVGIKNGNEIECSASGIMFNGSQFQAQMITNYLQSNDLDSVEDYVIGTKTAGLWVDKCLLRKDGHGNSIVTVVLENDDSKPLKKLLKINGYIGNTKAALIGGIVDMPADSICTQSYTINNMLLQEAKPELESIDSFSGSQIEKVSYFDGSGYRITGFIKIGSRQQNIDYLFQTLDNNNYLIDYYRLQQTFNAGSINNLDVHIKGESDNTLKIDIPVKNSYTTSFKVSPQFISKEDNQIKANNVLFNFSNKVASRQIINVFYNKKSQIKDFVVTPAVNMPQNSITNYQVRIPTGIENTEICDVKALFSSDLPKSFMPYNYSYKLSDNVIKFGFILNKSIQKAKSYTLEVKLYKKGSKTPIVEQSHLESDNDLIAYSSTLDTSNITKITAAIKDDRNKIISPKYFDIIYIK